MDEIKEANKTQAEDSAPQAGDTLNEMLTAAQARVAELEQALSVKEGEIAALKSSQSGLEAKMKGLDGALSAAVKGYRTLTAQVNPDILPELLVGDTVQAIEESVSRGKEIVARVKRGVEAEISRGRFPAGAPERGKVDLDLSPREKIQQGILSGHR
jgi:hypothetical protein